MLLDALGFEPATIDVLVERTGLPGGSIASMLLILELDGCVAGKRRVIVIGDGRPEHRRQPVTHFLADDAAELTHRGPHGRQRRLQTQQGLLGFQLGDQVRRVNNVRAKDGHELPLTDRILNLGVPRIADRARAAMGAPKVAGVHRRLTGETVHFCDLIGTKMSNETP